jgi:small subunit ribosomal protein S6
LREYETTFIVQPEISDEGIGAIQAKVDSVLERSGAVRLMVDDWGKRKLAYEIKKFQKGHYVLINYLDPGPAVPEVERVLRLEDSVLRFLTVKVADHVEDIEKRKVEAAEQERIRREKAAERAAREAREAEREAREGERRERDEDDRGRFDDDDNGDED